MLALWMGTSAACRGRGFEIESRKLKNQQRSSALFLNVSRRSPSCTNRIYIWKKNCSVVIAAFLRVNPVDSFSRGGCSERKYMCTQTHTLREVLQATEVRFHQHPLSSCSSCRPCSETFTMFCRLFLIIKKKTFQCGHFIQIPEIILQSCFLRNYMKRRQPKLYPPSP